MYGLPRLVKLGLRGLHRWFRSLSTTLLYPSVGQAWVTGVLGVSLVAGVLGVRGGETACLLSNFNFRFQFFFSLADVVIRTSYYVHISCTVFQLVPIPGYFVDGYTRHPGKY